MHEYILLNKNSTLFQFFHHCFSVCPGITTCLSLPPDIVLANVLRIAKVIDSTIGHQAAIGYGTSLFYKSNKHYGHL